MMLPDAYLTAFVSGAFPAFIRYISSLHVFEHLLHDRCGEIQRLKKNLPCLQTAYSLQEAIYMSKPYSDHCFSK